MNKSNLVVFTCGDEVIVCTKESESKVMEEWFGEGTGRTVGDDFNDYARIEVDVAVSITRGWLRVGD